MSRNLLITVHLHEGRYHGMGDEPPSPARLFQALLAGAGLSGPLPSHESEALEWLEKLDPPVIGSPVMKNGQAVVNYVPNNDLDAVGADVRRIGEIRAQKITRPRLFDADIPFIYVWHFDDDGGKALAICALAEQVYQFGRGIDLAWAWGEVLDKEEAEARLSSYPGAVYRPSRSGSGGTVACPQKGSLRSLKDRFAANSQRFKTEGRDRGAKRLFSQPPKPRFTPVAYDSPPSRRVYELRRGTGESLFAVWPLTRAPQLALELRDRAVARLRGALPERDSDIERFLVGRKADGADNGPTSLRVKIVPLPSIGHHHADRGIRRVLVEVPVGCPLRADDVHWALSGLELSASGFGDRPIFVTSSSDESMLLHYGMADRGFDLWRTVTPAALPESARRRRIDPARGPAEAKGGAERAAEQSGAAGTVVQALRHADIRTRADVIRVQREPFEGKGERVEPFAPGTRFAKDRLWHVEIKFAEPVKGPLVIGDGRFLGLGVMAPVQWSPQPDSRGLSLARFAVNGPVRPSVTETVPVAEQARRGLLSTCGYLVRRADASLTDSKVWPLAPAFWGKNEQARPSVGHRHAFFLPADEDGDGCLDHLTVYAPMGFNSLERRAFGRLRRIVLGEEEAVRLILIGCGRESDFRSPLLETSAVWVSATPFVVTRHIKRNGRKRDPQAFFGGPDGRMQFVRQVLIEELQRRGLFQEGVEIEPLPHVGAHHLRALQFRLTRRKSGDDGGSRPHGLFRLRFPRPVTGPIALGHSCHFGLGLFVPE
jgi:CRISPR-associated protein Csb2